jgi:hypothetical protein
VFTAKVEEIALEDGRLQASWGKVLYRVLLVAGSPAVNGKWRMRISG